MRFSSTCRRAVLGVALAACVAAPAPAATTVARVSLEIPASHGHPAASVELAGYTLDTVADFSLVLVASNATRTTSSRVTIAVPAAADGTPFSTDGVGSRFPLLTIRQADASGTVVHRTALFDVRVVRVKHVSSDYGDQRRVTLSAARIVES